MPGLGDEFRAAREARHLSLLDVSEQLHIRTVYLQHIEDGSTAFAAPVYVRGFIRTYARFLGLDPGASAARYEASLGETARKVPEPTAVAPSRTGGGPSPWLWIAGIAAAILVAFVGYKFVDFQQSGGATRATVAGIASSAPVTNAGPVATRAGAAAKPKPLPPSNVTQTLEVRVTQDSWMSVKVDGASRLEGVVKAGTSKAFHGKSADVRAGNAGGVDLAVNGKELGKMGNTGAVVERSLTLVGQ